MSKTVTRALRETFSELNLPFPKIIYSDSRRNKTAVGVKLVRKEISEEDMLMIERRMKWKGFKFLSKKMNKGGFYPTWGTRLTFENYNQSLVDESQKLIYLASDFELKNDLSSLSVTMDINDIKKKLGLRENQELIISGL